MASHAPNNPPPYSTPLISGSATHLSCHHGVRRPSPKSPLCHTASWTAGGIEEDRHHDDKAQQRARAEGPNRTVIYIVVIAIALIVTGTTLATRLIPQHENGDIAATDRPIDIEGSTGMDDIADSQEDRR